MDVKVTLSSPYPPAHIVMPQFSQHKRDGDIWHSPPFYSAPGGYKLCLCVVANGCGDGKGTHVSIFVYLQKGEHDDLLQWPFEHDVTYGILNWERDENHVIRTLNFKTAPTKCKERVTSQERWCLAWGIPQFLLQSSLSDGDTQYLHNDCLCLVVFKIEPPE